MSRTYRRDRVSLDRNHKPILVNESPYDYYNWHFEKIPIDYYSKRNYRADQKPRRKPPKWFKKEENKPRKAKVKESMRRGNYDVLPLFKKENIRHWN